MCSSYETMYKTLSVVLVFLLFLSFSSLSTARALEQDYNVLTSWPSKDASISSSYSMDYNIGADTRLDFGYNNYTDTAHRFLVHFNLPAGLSGEHITSATLKLWGPHPWSSGYPSGEALVACRVTQDWFEGTGKSGELTQDGVTWNEYNYADGLAIVTNNWEAPGGDYTLEDSSSVVIPPYPRTWTHLNITVTNIVKGWANNDYPNYGFLIRLDNESGAYKGGVFNSREYGEIYGEEYLVKLEVNYTVPRIESCNVDGEQRDYFELGETVYVNGSGFSPSTAYGFYVVVDQNWTDGMSIQERIPETATSIVTDSDGIIGPTDVWNNPQIIGDYDIVIDFNGNEQYDVYVDALDDGDVEITAGLVIPEFSPWTLLITFMIAAVAIVWGRKDRFDLEIKSKHS
jgi:hypothetical protein